MMQKSYQRSMRAKLLMWKAKTSVSFSFESILVNVNVSYA